MRVGRNIKAWRGWRSGGVALAVFVLLVQGALATHEADHRYVVSGYVRDQRGVPIENAVVRLSHKGGEKKEVRTNSSGYYEVLFHLHNENLGDEIIIQYGDVTKRHEVVFDPEDKFTPRGVEVSFGAPGKKGAVVWIYLTIASLALFGAVLYFGLLKNRPKRRTKGVARKRKRKKKQ